MNKLCLALLLIPAAIVGIGRLMIPGHGLSWAGTYEAFAPAIANGAYTMTWSGVPCETHFHADDCAKASKAERDFGLDGLAPTRGVAADAPRGGEAEKTTPRLNSHPTVKPLALMRWMVRLVCPAGGVLLDPFGGSGTTGIAAMQEGVGAVIIEQDAGHVEIIRRRLAANDPLFASGGV